MTVYQISVFLENRTGQLAEITKILADNNIDMRAISIAETADYGVLRIIVDRPQKATSALLEHGFVLSMTPVLAVVALTFSTASNVGVIVSASPLFAALFTLLLSRGKERPRWSFLLGFVVSMAGICLISFNGSQLSLDPRGDLLAVLAAVVWAVYSLLTKQIGGYGWNVIQTTRRIFGWGILFMIPAAAVMDFRLGLERLSEPSYVGMFLYLGLGACAACFVTWNFAIKTLGPIKTMVYIYLVPVITVVCSVLILREVVTPMSAGGTLLTLVGLALSQWDSLKQLRGRRGQEASREEDLEAKP